MMTLCRQELFLRMATLHRQAVLCTRLSGDDDKTRFKLRFMSRGEIVSSLQAH